MIQEILRLVAISILLAISAQSQTQGCCEISQCNFEKVEISRQLLTLASQIQSQVITSSMQNDCSTSISNNTSITTITTFEPPTASTTTTSTTTMSELPTSTTTTAMSEFPTSTTTTTMSELPTTTSTTTVSELPTSTTTTPGPAKHLYYIPSNLGNFTYSQKLCPLVKDYTLLTIDTLSEWNLEVKVKLRELFGKSPYAETQFFWVDGSLVDGFWSWVGKMTQVDLTYIPLKLWSGLTEADNQTALMLVYERLVDHFYLSPIDPATKEFPFQNYSKIATTIKPFCEKEI